MQQNGQKKISAADAKSAATHPASAATMKKEMPPPSSMPPAAASYQTPSRDPASAKPADLGDPFAALSQPNAWQTGTGAMPKPAASGDRHALIAGLFVMFSLALALAVGWWATPPAVPTFSLEASSRDERPAVTAVPPVTRDNGMGSYGTPLETTGLTEIDPDAVEGLAVVPSTANTPSPSAAAQRSETRATSTPVPPSPAATAANSKSNDVKAAEREAEMQRLKTQAYSETQKDRLGNSPPVKPAAGAGDSKSSTSSSSSSATPSRDRPAQAKRVDLSQALAECDKEVGLFYRERCKWRLCNGRWGKYGCPSYQHDSRAIWQIGGLKRMANIWY